MYLTHVRHTVKDYDSWRKAFDENAPMLEKAGALSTTIVQIGGNPNDIAVINTWPSSKHWDDFIAMHGKDTNTTLEDSKKKGGLIGEPQWYGGEVMESESSGGERISVVS